MPAGRPSKYTFEEARKIDQPCVYVFMDGESPVYVGKTKSPRKRFHAYTGRHCHNAALRGWLSEKGGDFAVEIYFADDIAALEVRLIKRHKGTLFNISNGKETDWYTQNKICKPWVAGRGTLCPTSIALSHMREDQKSTVRSWLKTLSDAERCQTEVQLAMAYGQSRPLDKRFDKWARLTADKMLPLLESLL